MSIANIGIQKKRNREFKVDKHKSYQSYKFSYILWEGSYVNVEIIDLYLEYYNDIVYAISDLIYNAEVAYFVLHLPMVNNIKEQCAYLHKCLRDLSKHKKNTKVTHIVINSKDIEDEKTKPSYTYLKKQLALENMEILESVSYLRNSTQYDHSKFTDEFYCHLETVIYSKLLEPLTISMYQDRVPRTTVSTAKSRVIQKVLEVTELDQNVNIYPLFKQVFNNKYLRSRIFKKVNKIHKQLGLESRKFSEISSMWCVNNNLWNVLKCKLKYENGFYMTPNAMTTFLRKNRDLELMKLLMEYLLMDSESEYPKTSPYLSEQCAIAGSVEIIEYIRELGYDLSIQTLYHSIHYGHLDLVKFILEKTTIRSILDGSPSLRKKSISLANQYGYKPILHLLKNLTQKQSKSNNTEVEVNANNANIINTTTAETNSVDDHVDDDDGITASKYKSWFNKLFK
ncbi:hypothetical protein DLAC_02722 [Tieghemostelium lacteum]|uniref:Ankyrin repeat-containing protein n=1 Tax=Tieghemostelium lacteum TaxID=361077 RepID=A0A152A348_TIELA|nr:hypothetical protein DLAC_02722 [Tieghemostelium lacteum]|eukprot:KYR00683.1 hypothetical protein DLAC_02722 [Tieghemostelium lacteum]